MNNAIERGRERLRDWEQIKASCREIFTTAIELLETKGQPEKNVMLFKYQVLRYAVNSRKPEINVQITAGADLKKARKVSLHIQSVGRLDVRKISGKGQELFMGRVFNIDFASSSGIDLYGNSPTDVDTVHGYLNAIKQVRSEIIPH